MIRAALLLSLLGACAEQPDAGPAAPTVSDPVAQVRLWLAERVFVPPAQMPVRFAPNLVPEDFPPRLLVDRPEDYRFVDLWRVRTVDGRLLIDALVTLAGRPHLISMRLEESGDRWQVAAWGQTPRPIEAPGPAPRAHLDLPAVLAGAAFRGAPPALVVPVAPSSAELAEEQRAPVRVRFKGFAYQGECPKARVAQEIRRQRRRVLRCYREAFGSEARGGRLTFSVEMPGSGPTRIELLETTLLAGALTDCVEEALGRIALKRVSHCTVQVPITFSPRR